MAEERRRILDLLAEGRINADQAEELLSALTGALPAPPAPPGPQQPPAGVRGLQIRIVNDQNGQVVNVTVPIGLVRFASRMIPADARSRVRDNGIDLEELIQSFEDPETLTPGTVLLEVTADSKKGGTDTIVIRAV